MSIKIKLLHKAHLLIGDNPPIEVERIGRGRYTTAWKNGTAVYLQTSDADQSKNILQDVASDNPYLPKIKQVGRFDSDHTLYKQPIYSPLLARHSAAWADFKIIAQARDDAWSWAAKQIPWSSRARARVQASDVNARTLEILEGNPSVPPQLLEAVDDLVRAAGNYGNYVLEFTKRNCAVDADGHLVLLDPLFDLSEVQAQQDRQMRKARGY